MLSAALYQTVYLLLVFGLTVLVMQRYAIVDFTEREDRPVFHNRIAWILTLFFVLFIGLRPISGRYFLDMASYDINYRALFWGKPFNFVWDTNNIVFDNLYAFCGSQRIPIVFVFLMLACIYFVCMMIACKKLFPKDALLSLLVYLGAFSTFSYGTNGMKAGAAASIFLLAIAYRENKWLSVVFLFVSFGFHHSMAAAIAIFIVSMFVKDRRFFLYGWIICLILAALHITYFQEIFAGFTDEQGAGYLAVEGEKRVSGFRPDFIIYSAIPVFLGNYLIRKFEIEDDDYTFLLNLYTGTNTIFLLCTYGIYINRIAYLSWLMYPFVLIYPFLNADLGDYHNRYLKYTVFGHLGFTLFMSFMYYA